LGTPALGVAKHVAGIVRHCHGARAMIVTDDADASFFRAVP
jgi:hypothetical protein